MIVTDRDAPIADYAVRSYERIRGVRFRLRVYANWLTPATKDRYLSSWRELDFVDIHENPSRTDEERPDPRVQRGLAGPFEKAYSIWDRELAKITTPLHATVDADLEIFDDRFVHDMVGRLGGDEKLVAVSLE